MTTEKKICCLIMILQTVSILSAVILLYMTVIFVLPSKRELALQINEDPIMCTTVHAEDKALGKVGKVECQWTTCGEWCMSKSTAICMQISALPRLKGPEVSFSDCGPITDESCSALNVSLTQSYDCNRGKCQDLMGMFSCKKEHKANRCKNITAAYDCSAHKNKVNHTIISCQEECQEVLKGVYSCYKGGCRKFMNITYQQCKRKCSDLNLADVNVVMLSTERLISSRCKNVVISSSSMLSQELGKQMPTSKVMSLFCTYAVVSEGNIIGTDCFDGILTDANDIRSITQFLDLKRYIEKKLKSSPQTITPEKQLQLMNVTQLRINSEMCVNTLRDECMKFFRDRSHDGRDGITPDRYPCYYTNTTTDYVIGKYEPEILKLRLLICSILPGVLFVVSCICLLMTSKATGVDDRGHLHIKLLAKTEDSAKKL